MRVPDSFRCSRRVQLAVFLDVRTLACSSSTAVLDTDRLAESGVEFDAGAGTAAAAATRTATSTYNATTSYNGDVLFEYLHLVSKRLIPCC